MRRGPEEAGDRLDGKGAEGAASEETTGSRPQKCTSKQQKHKTAEIGS